VAISIGSVTEVVGPTAQGGTENGSGSLGNGNAGHEGEDEDEGEIRRRPIYDQYDVDIIDDELGGSEQAGADTDNEEDADIAGGGLAVGDETEDASDDEGDAAVDSFAIVDVAAVDSFVRVDTAVVGGRVAVIEVIDDNTDLTEDRDNAEENLIARKIL
jgi:hypothetical protein